MSGGGETIDARRVVFVPSVGDAPAPRPDTAVVVIDTAWAPGPGDRPDLRSIKPLAYQAVERSDLFGEALGRLDEWAASAMLPDRLLVEGVTYWYRMREPMWRWLHERLVWCHVLARMLPDVSHVEVVAPAAEEGLLDVLHSMGANVRPAGASAVPQRRPAVGSGASVLRRGLELAASSIVARLGRRLRGPTTGAPRATGRNGREDLLADRVQGLVLGTRPRVLVLTTPSTYQRVGSGGASRRTDPNLGRFAPGLEAAGLDPIVMAMGTSHLDEGDWELVAGDDHLLPQTLLRVRWAGASDQARVAAALESCAVPLAAAADVPLDVDGVNLAPCFVGKLRASVERTVAISVQQLARIERMLDELTPSAIVLSQEGNRTSWVTAGARSGVPVFAVQHGVLYLTHPGYPDQRHEALVLPARTFVYGNYERAVLLWGAYLDAEVEVSGSPRLDLDHAIAGDAAPTAERAAVRHELGVADGDRMLVVSTVDLEFIRRFHVVHMVERVLGGPLPGIHVVFKQHPGERDPGPYRRLLRGLATAGGYEPPQISVVRDIDLYRLLRSADAHLGLHSTVLTDAVVAGTPNLIAIVEGKADMLGYVPAGVARPVHDVAELRAAMADPQRSDPDARRAFLDDHFRSGDATGRIVASIASTIAQRQAGVRDSGKRAAAARGAAEPGALVS